MDKIYCVYILTNERNTVLYTGVTGDLKNASLIGIERNCCQDLRNRYNVSKLVYYEAGHDASGAIAREKQIKGGSRRKKIDLDQSAQSRMARSLRGAVTRIEIASSLRSSQ